MDTIKSARDIMLEQKNQSYKIVDKPIRSKVIKRVIWPAEGYFSYCPFCVDALRKAGSDYKEILKPLISITYKNLYRIDDKHGFIVFENLYECSRCHKQMTNQEYTEKLLEETEPKYEQTGFVLLDEVKRF